MRLPAVALLGLAIFGVYVTSSPSIEAVSTTEGSFTTVQQDGATSTPTCVTSSARRQVAYYRASDSGCHMIRPSGIDSSDYTYAMLAFAVFDPDTFAVGMENPDNPGVYRQLFQLPDKVHKGIAISGHAWSTMSSTKTNRNAFIDSLKSFLTAWKFTGIEINWEGLGASDRGGNVADARNEADFIRELRDALGKDFSISVVLPAQSEQIDTTHLKDMQDTVNWFTVLAYDLDGRPHVDPAEIDAVLNLLWSANLDMSKINMAIASRDEDARALELDLTTKHCLGGTSLWITDCDGHDIPPQLPRGPGASSPSPIVFPRSPQGIPTDPISVTTSARGTAIQPTIIYSNPPLASSVVATSHYIVTSVQGSAKSSSVAGSSPSTPQPASSPWVSSVQAPAPPLSATSSPWVSSVQAPASPSSVAWSSQPTSQPALSQPVSPVPVPAPSSSAVWSSQSSSQAGSSGIVPTQTSSSVQGSFVAPSSGTSVSSSAAAGSSSAASSSAAGISGTATSSNAGSSVRSNTASGSVPSSSVPSKSIDGSSVAISTTTAWSSGPPASSVPIPGSSAQPSGSSSAAGSSAQSSSQAGSSGLGVTSTAAGSSAAQSSGGAGPSSIPGVSQTISPASSSSNTPEVTPIIPIIPPGSHSSSIPGGNPSIPPSGTPSSNTPGATPTIPIIPPGSHSSSIPGGNPSITLSSSNMPGGKPSINPSSSNAPGGNPSITSSSSNMPGGNPSVSPSSSNAPGGNPSITPSSSNMPGGNTSVSPSSSKIPGGTPPISSPGSSSSRPLDATPPAGPPSSLISKAPDLTPPTGHLRSSSSSNPGVVPKPTGTLSRPGPVPTTTICPSECGALDWCKIYCQGWVFPRPIYEQPPGECLLPENFAWCHPWWFGPEDINGSDGDPDSHSDSDPDCKPNNCIADCIMWRLATFIIFKRPVCPCVPKKCDKDHDSDSPSDSDNDDPKGPKPKPTSYPKPNKPECKLLGCGCGWMGLPFGPGCPGKEIELNIPCGIFGCKPCIFFGNCSGDDKTTRAILGYGGYCRGSGCPPCPPELCNRSGCTIAGGCGPKPGPAPTRPANEPDPDDCEDNKRTVITERFVMCTEGFDVSAIPSSLWGTGSTSSTMVTSVCLPLIDATQTLCGPAFGFDTTTTRSNTNTLTSDAPACTRAPLSLDDDEGNNNPDDSLFDTSSTFASNTTMFSSSTSKSTSKSTSSMTSSSASKTSTSSATPTPSHKPMDRNGQWNVDIAQWMWDDYSEVAWTLYDPNGFEAGKHDVRGYHFVEMKDYIQSVNRPFNDSMPFGVDMVVVNPHDQDHSTIKLEIKKKVSGCSRDGVECMPHLNTEDYTESQPFNVETCENACSKNGKQSPINKLNFWCDDLNKADWEKLPSGWKRHFKCGWKGYD